MKNENICDKIFGELKKKAEIPGKKGEITLPGKIKFEFIENGDTVLMTMQPKYAGLGKNPANMQEDNAAFEVWALYLHVHCGYNICLALSEYKPVAEYYSDMRFVPGHYNRFLYRVHKFLNQFSDWFSCDSKLKTRVDEYAQHLFCSDTKFTNNIPNHEAGSNQHLEILTEKAFSGVRENVLIQLAEREGVHLYSGKIYRQLPVGLFRGKCALKNREFTGGKSAIDLWSPTDNRLSIFELKRQNPMSGIITELFFYANYINDMFIEENSFVPYKSNRARKYYRGYQHLADETFYRVTAFFLADIYHPLFTSDILNEMNRGAGNITYGKLQYNLETVLGVVE